ncbi:hypothetical protein E0H80_03185 [Acinetobacter sp. ANC 4779]|uniref:hypothetical protein n=1 Tax=Acinetobacter sp. ANC 4779 TaxID=2529848 RepID=UPI00103D3B55|nr:hypothetical protein [Acinetobacter sp. ANC 4779]TCB51775.1 hypothetical protein E0H80_03185 [Acinetobacter sp. ANC 4779]
MGQDGGVEGRDYIENNSWAIVSLMAFGLDSPTRLYLYSQHVRQRNIPDGGIPTVGMEGFYNTDAALTSAPNVKRENYYSHLDDHADIDADMLTAKIESVLAENVKPTNMTRLGKTHMQRVLTGINSLSTKGSSNPNDWIVNCSRQGVDQENKNLANQTTLNLTLKTGAIEHDVVAGIAF